jgi:hypothetical protein
LEKKETAPTQMTFLPISFLQTTPVYQVFGKNGLAWVNSTYISIHSLLSRCFLVELRNLTTNTRICGDQSRAVL